MMDIEQVCWNVT